MSQHQRVSISIPSNGDESDSEESHITSSAHNMLKHESDEDDQEMNPIKHIHQSPNTNQYDAANKEEDDDYSADEFPEPTKINKNKINNDKEKEKPERIVKYAAIACCLLLCIIVIFIIIYFAITDWNVTDNKPQEMKLETTTTSIPSWSTTSVPTIIPSTTMPEAQPCGDNTWCYYIDIFPEKHKDTNWTTTVQHIHEKGTDLNFNLIYSVSGDICYNPKISMSFERIDYDTETKYIHIFDNDDVLIRKCGGGSISNSCQQFDECLVDTDLSVDYIDIDDEYEITLYQPATVDALCAEHHSFVINADVTLHCLSDVSTTTTNIPITTTEETVATVTTTTTSTTNPTTTTSTNTDTTKIQESTTTTATIPTTTTASFVTSTTTAIPTSFVTSTSTTTTAIIPTTTTTSTTVPITTSFVTSTTTVIPTTTTEPSTTTEAPITSIITTEESTTTIASTSTTISTTITTEEATTSLPATTTTIDDSTTTETLTTTTTTATEAPVTSINTTKEPTTTTIITSTSTTSTTTSTEEPTTSLLETTTSTINIPTTSEQTTTSDPVSRILRIGNTVENQGLIMTFPAEAFPDSLLEIIVSEPDAIIKQIFDESTVDTFDAMPIDDITKNHFLFIVENDPLPTPNISYIFTIPIPNDVLTACPDDYGYEIFTYNEQNGFGDEIFPSFILIESIYNDIDDTLITMLYPEMWIHKEADLIISCTPGVNTISDGTRRRRTRFRTLLHRSNKNGDSSDSSQDAQNQNKKKNNNKNKNQRDDSEDGGNQNKNRNKNKKQNDNKNKNQSADSGDGCNQNKNKKKDRDKHEDKNKNNDKHKPRIKQCSDTSPNDSCLAASILCPIPSKKGGCNVLYPFSRTHIGVDYKANNLNILAVASGIIEISQESEIYGNRIILRHDDGSKTVYKNLRERYVVVNDTVSEGDVIARSYSKDRRSDSDSHLHLEYIPNGVLYETKTFIDSDACIISDGRSVTSGSIHVIDSGTSLDDAFKVKIDGYCICKTRRGESKTCDINNLHYGDHILTLKILHAPDGYGTFQVTLHDGWTFDDGTSYKNNFNDDYNDEHDKYSNKHEISWNFHVPCN